MVPPTVRVKNVYFIIKLLEKQQKFTGTWKNVIFHPGKWQKKTQSKLKQKKKVKYIF